MPFKYRLEVPTSTTATQTAGYPSQFESGGEEKAEDHGCHQIDTIKVKNGWWRLGKGKRPVSVGAGHLGERNSSRWAGSALDFGTIQTGHANGTEEERRGLGKWVHRLTVEPTIRANGCDLRGDEKSKAKDGWETREGDVPIENDRHPSHLSLSVPDKTIRAGKVRKVLLCEHSVMSSPSHKTPPLRDEALSAASYSSRDPHLSIIFGYRLRFGGSNCPFIGDHYPSSNKQRWSPYTKQLAPRRLAYIWARRPVIRDDKLGQAGARKEEKFKWTRVFERRGS